MRPSTLSTCLLVGFLCGIVPGGSFAQESPVIANVRFEVQPEQIIILYDLAGRNSNDQLLAGDVSAEPRSTRYRVSLILRRESNPEFRYVPKYVSGDVGRFVSEGKNRTIRWNVLQEFPQGLEGSDFYFEVILEPLETKPNYLTWVIASGAAVLGGTALYFFLSKDIAPPPSGSFPPPPGRPQ